jgi:S-DNA-T family DNA segregation ATPase FtsK/SpoIIIE
MASSSTRSKRAPARKPAKRASGKATARTPAVRKPAAKKPAARKPAKKAAPKKPPRQPIPPDRLRDIWGGGVLVLGVLCGLGLYARGSAGLLGEFLVGLCRGLFGVFGLAVPVLLAGFGILLLREPRPANRRLVAGTTLGLLAVMGLWHLAAAQPVGFEAGTPILGQLAGWVGAGVAVPLRTVAATPGALVILVALLLVALMLVTATPPRVAVEAVTGAFLRHIDPEAPALREWRWRREPVDDEAHDYAHDDAHDDPEPEPPRLDPPDEPPELRTDEIPIALPPEPEPEPQPELELSDTQLLPRGVDTGGGARKLLPRMAAPQSDYRVPSLDLLRAGRTAPGNKRTLDQMERALAHTLSQFGVNARVAKMSRGPTVTRFEITLGEGVKVAAVTKLEPDISYALATPEIRIVAPIPGKSAIGIEVPNRDRDLVALGDVLRSPEAAAQHHPLAVGLGVDIANNPVMVNLASMPHLLIAGATGSGKSVTMNGIVTSVLARATPEQAKMILIDPKRVELNHYEGAPHLLTQVVTDPKRATEALDWVVREMEQRYERLAMLGYRNIDSYNAAVRDGTVRQAPVMSGQADVEWEELPYILTIVDELADLMMVAPRDVEGSIVRIAQMARAVGIHLIVATQRPSVDVVTGLIKANIPSRIALAMATQADSRTILDQGGAEKLVGDGDMLFMPANANKPHRIQGCYVSESEIEQIVGWCKDQREAMYTPGVVREGEDAIRAGVTGEDADDAALTRAAMDLVVRSGLGSTSMLQRKLKVGFARAGRLMDELEQMGVVGPSEGPKARQVLMTIEELQERL